MEFQKIEKVLIKTFFLNWIIAALKILIGFLGGAISILADGFHSFFDGISNILGLAGIKMARKLEDPCHPYGHQKFAALATLGIGFMILITSYEIFKKAIEGIIHPSVPEITSITFLVLIGSLVVDFFVYRYENSEGKKLKSNILIADSLHTKTHFFTTSSVILGMIGIKAGVPILDPIVAFFVVLMLLRLAREAVQETVASLTDRALINIKRIQEIANTIPGVETCHQIRTRGEKYYVFLDMHVLLKPNLTLLEAHSICHRLEEKIKTEIPQIKDIIIHPEPKNYHEN